MSQWRVVAKEWQGGVRWGGGGGWEDQRSRQTPSVELQGMREKTINITHRLREHCCWNLDSPGQGTHFRTMHLENAF